MSDGAIVPPDILGFETKLAEELFRLGFEAEIQVGGLLDMVKAFAQSYRALDQWKLDATRTKTWAPWEPCFLHSGPAVVLSLGTVRVSVRTWVPPQFQPDEPMTGRVCWCEPRNIGKVSTGAVWHRWCQAMGMCGHSAVHWTLRDFQAAVGGEGA